MSDLSRVMESAMKAARAERSDPINPDHYKFPSGVEVIDLSEHLTSNAGQAVQYLARACRLDGRVKSDPVEDVKKAVWFAQRELARLEAQQ